MAKIDGNNSATGFKIKAIIFAKIGAGTLLMTIFPKRRAQVEREATIPWHAEQQPDAIDRLIRASLMWWRSRDSSGIELAQLHQNFWSEQSSKNYYAGTQGRFEKTFMPHFDHFLDQVATEVHKLKITNIVEIGCGDGQLLRHLQKRIPLNHYVGIDLSEDQISINQAESGPQGPEYFSGNAAQWIAENAPSHTLYVTGLGVLEYFTQAQLSALLNNISSSLCPACALFIEPIDSNADYDTFDQSYVAGEEHSFTHNYPMRLKQAGWTLISSEEVKLENYRWTVTLAAC